LGPTALAALDIGPGWPATPIKEDKVMASFAAASKALKTPGFKNGLDFDRAETKMG
jgi:hypothetical protein